MRIGEGMNYFSCFSKPVRCFFAYINKRIEYARILKRYRKSAQVQYFGVDHPMVQGMIHMRLEKAGDGVWLCVPERQGDDGAVLGLVSNRRGSRRGWK
jgi:hypothetical protein